MVLRFLLLIY